MSTHLDCCLTIPSIKIDHTVFISSRTNIVDGKPPYERIASDTALQSTTHPTSHDATLKLNSSGIESCAPSIVKDGRYELGKGGIFRGSCALQ